MSSTTVCHQALQTCLDPLVRLKLTPPKSNFPPIPGWDFNSDPQEKLPTEETVTNITSSNLNLINNKHHNIINKAETAGWSFIQSLDNQKIQNTKTENKTEEAYVHPLVKRSASVLSPRSLAMCTESLGSETGSDHGGDGISILLQSNAGIPVISLESIEKTNPRCDTVISDNAQARPPKRLNRTNGTTTFPPPLRSISSSNGVQVRPHREGGRLVLKAVSVVSPPTTYFEAERGDGRLRLRLLKGISQNCDIEEVAEDERQEELAAEDDQLVGVEEDEVQIEAEVETEEVEENRGNVVKTEEMQGNIGNGGVEKEDVEGNSGNVGGEKGMGKIPRPSRCKEGGRGNKKMVMNWPESFCVAT